MQRFSEALWSEGESRGARPPLAGDEETDVAIIGAGITGLSAAWHLLRAGLRVTVLEARGVGTGTSGSSTGNLYAPLETRLHTVEEKHDREVLREVVAARLHGIDLVERSVREFGIDCDFQRVPFHLFALDGAGAREEVEKESAAARNAGLTVTDALPADFPFAAKSLLSLAGQAQFNPYRYCTGLAAALDGAGCRIRENCPVREIDDGSPCEVHSAYGVVRAAHVIMATHTPKGLYVVHAAMQPHREYALAARLRASVAPPTAGIYWLSLSGEQYSLRAVRHGGEDYLLVLGKPHKTGYTKEGDVAELRDFLRGRFDIEDFRFAWAAQNYRSADLLPYIGTSMLGRKVHIATGFAADGLTWGALAGEMLADFVQGRDNRWARLFDPKRMTVTASAKNLAKENLSVASHLLKDYLHYKQVDALGDVLPGEGRTLEVGGEKVAAYRDEHGSLSVVSAVCTHLGCMLHWNGAEKSWDCPCHGSRFDVDGEVLEGPALRPLARPLGPKV